MYQIINKFMLTSLPYLLHIVFIIIIIVVVIINFFVMQIWTMLEFAHKPVNFKTNWYNFVRLSWNINNDALSFVAPIILYNDKTYK